MKKTHVKLLCLILTVVIAAAPLFSVMGSAKADYTADCPFIHVPGFMATDIFVDPSDPDSSPAWPPAVGAIVKAVFKTIPAFAKLAVTRNWEKFADDIMPAVNKVFEPIVLAPDGTVPNKSGPRFSYPETVNRDSELTFSYDWRIDPMEVAAQLNDFINYVCEKSGCEQVVLECHSYGGVITTTYVKMFGCEKVRSFLFNTTAVYGETYTGELMTGNIVLNADALTEYLKSALEYTKGEKALNFLFAVLNKTGITGALCKFANKMIEKIGVKVSAESIVPMFGGWLSVWAMVPDEYIDDAVDYVFNYLYKDSEIDYSGVYEKVMRFNKEIRPYKTDVLKYIDENANLYVVSRYGYSSMFLTPSWKNASDNIIDSKNNSFGATFADYGSVLTQAQLGSADSKYISPDKTVNASTCLFPEQTWFIRHLTHAYMPGSFNELVKALLYFDGQADVTTFEDYPRFLFYNEDTTQIIPDDSAF